MGLGLVTHPQAGRMLVVEQDFEPGACVVNSRVPVIKVLSLEEGFGTMLPSHPKDACLYSEARRLFCYNRCFDWVDPVNCKDLWYLLNHHREPSCEVKVVASGIRVATLRQLRVGEPLTWRYPDSYWEAAESAVAEIGRYIIPRVPSPSRSAVDSAAIDVEDIVTRTLGEDISTSPRRHAGTLLRSRPARGANSTSDQMKTDVAVNRLKRREMPKVAEVTARRARISVPLLKRRRRFQDHCPSSVACDVNSVEIEDVHTKQAQVAMPSLPDGLFDALYEDGAGCMNHSIQR